MVAYLGAIMTSIITTQNIQNVWLNFLDEAIANLAGKQNSIPYCVDLSPNTKKNYLCDLQLFRQWGNGRAFNPHGYKEHLLNSDYAPSTVNRKLASIRWLASTLKGMATGIVADNRQLQFKRDELVNNCNHILEISDVKYSQPLKDRVLSPAEFQQLVNAINGETLIGQRDKTMLCMLYTLGLRLAECLTVRISDYQNNRLSITGKGNKTRYVPVQGDIERVIDDWLSLRGGEGDDPIICKVSRKGYVLAGTMSTRAAQKRVNTIRTKANVAPFTPHDLRRTRATEVTRQYGISVAQQLLGHESITTTTRYVSLTMEDIGRAVGSVQL